MNIRTRLHELKSDERGMTLMEVIVAIAIMTTIAVAAASVSLNGTKTENAQERKQVAVTIANGYMESVTGSPLSINSATGVSNLYNGRTYADVHAAFDKYAAQPGVAQTNAVWDTLDPNNVQVDQAAPTLPITTTPPRQNGTDYTVVTLIGSCYQSTTVPSYGTTSAPVTNNCVAASGTNTDALIRVIVIVTWNSGAQCAVNGCFYDTSTLFDPSSDLEWVQH